VRLLFLVAMLAVAAWFAPQVVEGTEGACGAFERRMVAVLPGDPRVAREVAAQTARALGQLPHGGGCVVGWWRMLVEGQGPAAGR
jgi:hypothetical protein